MTVLVTGATGFIASHLLPALYQQEWQIKGTIRNSYSLSLSIPITKVIVEEIDGNTNWNPALQGIEIVIHLAGRAHRLNDTILNSEAAFFRVNTEGTANLVKQSIEAGVKHFIFISSIGAIATLSKQVLTENSPCQPDTAYGRSKLLAEQSLIQQATNSNMAWTIIRPPLVYGAGNPGNMERLIKLIKLGLPLPLGGINNRRSFIFVGNLVDAIITCLNHPQAINQIFLVSDGDSLSTPELVHKIAQQIKQPSYLFPVPLQLLRFLGIIGDGIRYFSQRSFPINTITLDRLLGSLWVNSSYIQKTLDWYPPFTIEQGLEQTLNFL